MQEVINLEDKIRTGRVEVVSKDVKTTHKPGEINEASENIQVMKRGWPIPIVRKSREVKMIAPFEA